MSRGKKSSLVKKQIFHLYYFFFLVFFGRYSCICAVAGALVIASIDAASIAKNTIENANDHVSASFQVFDSVGTYNIDTSSPIIDAAMNVEFNGVKFFII